MAESKSLDNSELSKEHKKERSDETIIKMKPVSKLKGKELNDRVKNQIRLMLSSDTSSDKSSVVKAFDKCGKPSKKDTKSSPTKKDKKLESKKQNGTSESSVKNDSECSADKSTKPPSPKKCTNASKKSNSSLPKIPENLKESSTPSASKSDAKTTSGVTKKPLTSPKLSKKLPDAKAKNKQVTTKTVVSDKEKIKKKSI